MISPGCTGMVNNVSTEGKTPGSDHPTNPIFSDSDFFHRKFLIVKQIDQIRGVNNAPNRTE